MRHCKSCDASRNNPTLIRAQGQQTMDRTARRRVFTGHRASLEDEGGVAVGEAKGPAPYVLYMSQGFQWPV